MATFDELRASRDRLANHVHRLESAVIRGRELLTEVNLFLVYAPAGRAVPGRRHLELNSQTALLLQELNAELKRDNDEAEAK